MTAQGFRTILLGALAAALASLALSTSASAATLQVYSVDPAFTPFNVAGKIVTIKGVGFRASTTVSFQTTTGPVAATVAFVNTRTLTATVPTVAAAQLATVTVTDSVNGTDDFFPFFYTGPVIYVATTGNDSNAGTSPAAPKKTITAGVNVNSAGTTPTEIRVAAGRYQESQIAVYNDTVITCGWAAGFASRDTDRQVTEIDGNRAGFVLRTFGLSSASVLDGCTIKNGLRDGFGGGAYVITADSPVVNNNVIVGNMSTTQGGGLYFSASTSYGGRPTLSNNVIVGNRSHGKGGGGFNSYFNYNTQQPVRVTVSGNQIVGNRSLNSRGGGVGITTGSYAGYNNATLRFTDNFIGYNQAKTGGGVDVSTLTYGDTMDVTYDNNLIVGNAVPGTGGGLTFQGLGTLLGRLTANTIVQNSAGPAQGGGLVIAGSINLVSTFNATDLILWGNLEGDSYGQAIARVTFSDVGNPVLTGTGDIALDPAFVSGPLGSYYLRQGDPNNPDSPAVNIGSAPASTLALDSLTTRKDLITDSGVGDLGYHYPAISPSSVIPISFLRIDPTAGDLNGTDWVLIRGDGFNPGATVTFGGNPASNVVYVSPTRILAQPAPHALGVVDVQVTNPNSTTVVAGGAYRYIDNYAPVWITTVGVISAQTAVDCVRSVVVDWNEAVDAQSPPVVYEIYREDCAASTNNQVPCANFGFIPSAVDFVGSTVNTFYVDLNFPTGGQDPKVIYAVRARDSATFGTNKEWNFAKRVSLASKLTTDTIPPSPVGNTLTFLNNSTFAWTGGTGAVSFAVYRTSIASQFATPGAVPKLATLTKLNNDLNGDGITDQQYTDFLGPPGGGIIYYKVTAIDPCNNETTSELLPQ